MGRLDELEHDTFEEAETRPTVPGPRTVKPKNPDQKRKEHSDEIKTDFAEARKTIRQAAKRQRVARGETTDENEPWISANNDAIFEGDFDYD